MKTHGQKRTHNFSKKLLTNWTTYIKRKIYRIKEQRFFIRNIISPNIEAFRAVMGSAYEEIGKYAGKENVKKFRFFDNSRERLSQHQTSVW